MDALCALLDCALGFFPCYFLFGCNRANCLLVTNSMPLQGPQHSYRSSVQEAIPACRAPRPPPVTEAQPSNSPPQGSEMAPAGLGQGSHEGRVVTKPQAPARSFWSEQNQPNRAEVLRPLCVGRWWSAPPVLGPEQQAQQLSRKGVLRQCLQQYRGGEPPGFTHRNQYTYRTSIDYHPDVPAVSYR